MTNSSIQYIEQEKYLAEVLFPENKPRSHVKQKIIKKVKQRIDSTYYLAHPNFINYDGIKEINGRYCLLIREKEKHVSLAEYLKNEKPSLKQIVKWAIAIAEIADLAEQKNYQWSGLTLNSLRVSDQGEIKVLDPEIVRLIKQSRSDLTDIISPENYLPPEVIGYDQWTQQGRIYSLGVIFYYVLTGKPPFSSNDKTEIYDKILVSSFIEPRFINCRISRELNGVVVKLLARNQEKRYQSWEEVITAIRELVSKDSLAAPAAEQQKNQARYKWTARYTKIKDRIMFTCKRQWKVGLVVLVVVFVFWAMTRMAETPPAVTVETTPEEVVALFYEGLARKNEQQINSTTTIELGNLELLVTRSYIMEQLRQQSGFGMIGFQGLDDDEKVYGLQDLEITEIEPEPKPVFRAGYIFFLNKEEGRETEKMEDLLYLEQVEAIWQIVTVEGSINKLIIGDLDIQDNLIF